MILSDSFWNTTLAVSGFIRVHLLTIRNMRLFAACIHSALSDGEAG